MAGRAAVLTQFSFTGDQGSNPWPSAYASMVKRKSFLASNEEFRVRVLVEAINHDRQQLGRATRLETGTGWKPVEHFENALRVRPPLLPLWPDPVLVSGDRL